MQQHRKSNRVMEIETIQKNGVSPKSLMSRGNFLLFSVLLFVLGLTTSVFISCDEEEPITEVPKPDEPSTIAVTSISLDKTTLILTKGQSCTLTATVKPDNATNKNVTWSSSDVSKVKVNANGEVTTVTTGEATITAMAGGKTATCKVTVSESDIAVTSISLDKDTLILAKGQTYVLTATVLPNNASNKTVTWTSSSQYSIVWMDNDGKITALNVGEATITATVDGKTATCMVTVPPIWLCIYDGTWRPTYEFEMIPGEEQTYYAVTSPTGQSTTWKSSDISKVTVEGSYGEGKIIAKAPGTATINVTYSSYTVSCIITIYDCFSKDYVTINGINWATRNVDTPGNFATKASDAGMFYQWNRRIGWSATDPITSSPLGHSWDSSIPTGNTWEEINDPSPTGYRVPTSEELSKLPIYFGPSISTATIRKTVNGVTGIKCGEGNNTIFLPYVGRRQPNYVFLGEGYYWSSTEYGSRDAYYFPNPYQNHMGRSYGLSIRSVKK